MNNHICSSEDKPTKSVCDNCGHPASDHTMLQDGSIQCSLNRILQACNCEVKIFKTKEVPV